MRAVMFLIGLLFGAVIGAVAFWLLVGGTLDLILPA